MSASVILLFDVMGTLVHDPFYVEVPHFFGMTLEALIVDKHPTAWVEFERGEIDEAALVAKFFKDGRGFDLEGLKLTMKRSYRLIDGMESLLDELASHQVSMHAFSNYPVWYRLIEEVVVLSRWIRWSFVSCFMGHRKPEQAAYAAVLTRLGRPAHELILIDDREINCLAARRAGMRAICFRDAPSLRTDLQALGILGAESNA